MKTKGVSARSILISAVLAGTLTLVGCANDNGPFGTAQRTPISPAPAGMPNSGIGAPGGASEDTRSVGTVAESEGQAIEGAPATNLGTTSSPLR